MMKWCQLPIVLFGLTNVLSASMEPQQQANVAVPFVNPDYYYGNWYEVYANVAVLNNFQKGTYCATASYGANVDGTISVHNYQRTDAPEGPVSDIYGYAYAPDMYKPGELVFRYNNVESDGSYWILGLGPVINERYDWSIVSDMNSRTLFILTRDVARFYELYEQEVVSMAINLGFAPIPIYQGSDCVYSPDDIIPPTPSKVPSDIIAIKASEFLTLEPTFNNV